MEKRVGPNMDPCGTPTESRFVGRSVSKKRKQTICTLDVSSPQLKFCNRLLLIIQKLFEESIMNMINNADVRIT